MPVTSVASIIRMTSNKEQGVTEGAAPLSNKAAPMVEVQDISNQTSNRDDWRVSLSVPSVIDDSPILKPLKEKTNSRMIFPFTPTVLLQQEANYSTVTVKFRLLQ